MKRKIYLPLAIVLAIGLIVVTLVLNKRATAAKTESLMEGQSAVAVRTETVSESDYSASFVSNGLVAGAHDSTMGSRSLSTLRHRCFGVWSWWSRCSA